MTYLLAEYNFNIKSCLSLSLSYRDVSLCLLLVAHRHDGQHQVDEVKRSEKYDDGKKYHMDWSAGGHDLKERRGGIE